MIFDSDLVNAQQIKSHAMRARDEARKNPRCAALVAHLDARIAYYEEQLHAYENHAAVLAEAEAKWRAATAEVERASARHFAGDVDRDAAIRARDDLDAARSALIVRTRERDEARTGASRPLQRILKAGHEDRQARQEAERVIGSIATQCQRGRATIEQGDPAKTPIDQCRWEPFAAARELAAYRAAFGTKRFHAEAENGKPHSPDELERVYAARWASREANVRQLTAALTRAKGASAAALIDQIDAAQAAAAASQVAP